MSYGIHLRPPGTGTPPAPIELVELEAALLGPPDVAGADGHYRVEDSSAGIWIEVDAGLVDAEGDLIEDGGGRVNQVWIEIPGSFFGSSEQRAIELALGLADALGWEAYDPQSGSRLERGTTRLDEPITVEPARSGRDPVAEAEHAYHRRLIGRAVLLLVVLVFAYFLVD